MVVRKYTKIWLLFFTNSFKKEFSDLKNILASHLAVIFWMLSVIFFYKVILDQVGDITGWETGEILILIGTYFTIDGLIYTFFIGTVSSLRTT